jgi:hypothetical protein
MKKELYYIAYKFLKFRSTNKNPFEALEKTNYQDQQTIISFLKKNHQVKFI